MYQAQELWGAAALVSAARLYQAAKPLYRGKVGFIPSFFAYTVQEHGGLIPAIWESTFGSCFNLQHRFVTAFFKESPFQTFFSSVEPYQIQSMRFLTHTNLPESMGNNTEFTLLRTKTTFKNMSSFTAS